jgi:hypothetical protein
MMGASQRLPPAHFSGGLNGGDSDSRVAFALARFVAFPEFSLWRVEGMSRLFVWSLACKG